VLAAWRAGLLRGAAREDPPRALVEISLAPPLAAPAPEAMAEPPGARRRTVAVKRAARGTNAGTRLPAQPSAAAPGAAGSPPAADAPLDLTATPLVVATTGARGTASGGRPGGPTGGGPGPTDARGAGSATPAGAGDRSGTVSLQQREWACPWPHEADDQQIDEQTVVIEVVVGPDGRAESATVLSDPGHGFGQAAIACALRTRFTPARDRQGQPTRATSPAVLVRFTR